ncbi:MAG: GyrI-like domain-containing protein [Planctomycetota bacterium]
MQTGLQFILIQLVVAASAALAESTPPPPPQTIAVKQTPVVNVVFLEHTGPYWRLGPVLTQLRELMLTHGESGPLYVRYSVNPVTVPPERLMTEVGFVRSARWDTPAGFSTGRRGGELVAYDFVDGPYGTAPRQFERLYAWVSANNYVPLGPLTEVYLTRPEAAAAASPQVEVQIPVRPASAEAGKLDPPFSEPVAAPTLAAKRDGPEVVARPAEDLNSPGVRVWPSPSELQSDSQPLAATVTAETGAAGVISPNAVAAAEPASPPKIEELIRQGRCVEAAARLIPLRPSATTDVDRWLDQVVQRLAMFARGLRTLDAPEAEHFDALTTAARECLSTRRGRTGLPSPIAAAPLAGQVRGGARDKTSASILRDMDILVTRIAQRAVSAEEATHASLVLVARAVDFTATLESESNEP